MRTRTDLYVQTHTSVEVRSRTDLYLRTYTSVEMRPALPRLYLGRGTCIWRLFGEVLASRMVNSSEIPTLSRFGKLPTFY